MNIVVPRKFQLFARTFKVEQPTKVIVEGESVLGSCHSDNALIQIRRNLKKELKELTWLHELVHAILDETEYRKLSENETFVELFSKGLHQALKTSE